ncbi:threonine synthase-like 2 [Reticulomyxa filosa]|uniref:Threonine synthase-like 2 n=1 Tax=Reticulomyxa filosa TaxID=46433 RepID=X6M4C1_RETFI|nr:threonine synthase-like 2 [Reticulomyxa filosa]|eukprot:ETO08466.1 threonine synthase-like 2 [Reticulomyxa filosa]
MDIQAPYNMERFFWLIFDQNTDFVKSVMESFEGKQRGYHFDPLIHVKTRFQSIIPKCYMTSDENILATIKYFYHNYDYVCCPHSACALYAGYEYFTLQHGKLSEDVPVICIATAHPSKFSEIVMQACSSVIEPEDLSNFKKQWLTHKALPQDTDKEYFHVLPNGPQWEQDWEDILKKDIQKVNQNYANDSTKSKL